MNIKPGEEATVFLLFAYLTLALTSFTIARAVRDSLFLDQYSALKLPYAYVSVAVIIGFLVSIYVKLSTRLNQAILISGTLLFFIGNVIVLWWLIHLKWSGIAAVFFIWTSIFGIITTAQVWTLAGMALNTRQARRLFPLILARIPSQNTVNLLIEALSDEDGMLRFRAIKGLNRLRIGDQAFNFDAKAIRASIVIESERALWFKHALTELYSEKKSRDLLAQLLKDKIHQGLECVFRLLGLVLPPTAAHAAYNAIVEENPSKKANALEYLDNVLSPQLKKWVLQLVGTRRMKFRDRIPDILDRFIKSKDRILHECTLDAAGKNRWTEFLPAGETQT